METRILAIDPGTKRSNYVVFDGHAILSRGLQIPNEDLEQALLEGDIIFDEAAIEEIRCYGQAVGHETLETCHWTGRLFTAANVGKGSKVTCLVPRLEVKLCLCHSPRAKDANVRQALLDHWGPKGTKTNPGLLYGVSSHLWAAMGVAHWKWATSKSRGTQPDTVTSGSRTLTDQSVATPSSVQTEPLTGRGRRAGRPGASPSSRRGRGSAKT